MPHRAEGLINTLQSLCRHFPGEVHDIKNLLTGLNFVKDMNRYHPVVDKAEQYVAKKGQELFARNRIMNSKQGSLTKTANLVKELIGAKGYVPPVNRAVTALLGGGAISGAATPYVSKEDWNNANAIGKAGLALQNALLGAAGAATGHDRFGIAGGLAGLGLANAASRGISAVKPQDESMQSWLLRALAEGGKASVSGSLMLSGLLKGGGARRLLSAQLPTSLKKSIIDSLPPGSNIEEYVGKPGSFLSGMMSAAKGEAANPGFLAKSFDYMGGAPNVTESVIRHGKVQDIPAGEYITGHAKDMIGGAVAHAPLAPLAALGGLAGHRNQEDYLKQTDYPAYVKLKIKQMKDRVVG